MSRFKLILLGLAIPMGLVTLIALGPMVSSAGRLSPAVEAERLNPIDRYEASLADAKRLNIPVDEYESIRRILAEIGKDMKDLKPEHMLPLPDQCRILPINDPHRPGVCDLPRR